MTSVSLTQGIVLRRCWCALPGVAGKSEFTSDYLRGSWFLFVCFCGKEMWALPRVAVLVIEPLTHVILLTPQCKKSPNALDKAGYDVSPPHLGPALPGSCHELEQ